DRFARGAFRQDAHLLLFGAEVADVRRDQPRVQRHEEATFAVATVLLDQDLLVAEVANARAAVLRVRPDQQVTLVTRLLERFAIDESLLAPTLAVRADLLAEETPRGIAELIVLGFEYGSLHISAAPCGSLRRGARTHR